MNLLHIYFIKSGEIEVKNLIIFKNKYRLLNIANTILKKYLQKMNLLKNQKFRELNQLEYLNIIILERMKRFYKFKDKVKQFALDKHKYI